MAFKQIGPGADLLIGTVGPESEGLFCGVIVIGTSMHVALFAPPGGYVKRRVYFAYTA